MKTAAQFEVISTHLPGVVDTRTENKRSWQSIITRLVTWRRNIHSLLTLAAEPSEPNVGAVVQPRGWPVGQGFRGSWGGGGAWSWALNGKAQPRVCSHCTFRKERAAGVVPAFTLLQKKKKSQVHFARASNVTFKSQTQFLHYIRALMHKLNVSYLCLWFQHCGVALSVWRKGFPMSIQCLCHS